MVVVQFGFIVHSFASLFVWASKRGRGLLPRGQGWLPHCSGLQEGLQSLKEKTTSGEQREWVGVGGWDSLMSDLTEAGAWSVAACKMDNLLTERGNYSTRRLFSQARIEQTKGSVEETLILISPLSLFNQEGDGLSDPVDGCGLKLRYLNCRSLTFFLPPHFITANPMAPKLKLYLIVLCGHQQ